MNRTKVCFEEWIRTLRKRAPRGGNQDIYGKSRHRGGNQNLEEKGASKTKGLWGEFGPQSQGHREEGIRTSRVRSPRRRKQDFEEEGIRGENRDLEGKYEMDTSRKGVSSPKGLNVMKSQGRNQLLHGAMEYKRSAWRNASMILDPPYKKWRMQDTTHGARDVFLPCWVYGGRKFASQSLTYWRSPRGAQVKIVLQGIALPQNSVVTVSGTSEREAWGSNATRLSLRTYKTTHEVCPTSNVRVARSCGYRQDRRCWTRCRSGYLNTWP